MISDMLSKHVGAVKSVLKKWFKNKWHTVSAFVGCVIIRNNMFRPNTGHLQVSSWKAVRKICYTIMQACTGVEYSSLACLVRYGLFYTCEKLIINWNRCICTFGGSCVVGWWLDNPCGGGITCSCCSQSSYQYQCGATLSADVCVDARLKVTDCSNLIPGVHGGAVGKGTAFEAGRSRVRLRFLIYLIHPAALWPSGRLRLKGN